MCVNKQQKKTHMRRNRRRKEEKGKSYSFARKKKDTKLCAYINILVYVRIDIISMEVYRKLKISIYILQIYFMMKKKRSVKNLR